MAALTDLASLAKEIDRHVTDANEHARYAVVSAIEAGVMLNRAKALAPHGQWNDWLRDNVSVAPRTAQAYMRLARVHPQLSHEEAQRVAELPLREAIKAVATPPVAPQRQRTDYIPRRSDRDRAVSQLNATATAIKTAIKCVEIGLLKPGVAAKARLALNKALAEIDRLEKCGELYADFPPPLDAAPTSAADYRALRGEA